jgi:hypothetical protein
MINKANDLDENKINFAVYDIQIFKVPGSLSSSIPRTTAGHRSTEGPFHIP